MDEIYKSELDLMRQQGHHLAEASMLSFDSTLLNSKALPTFHAKKMVLTLRLFKVMFDYLRSATPTTELVACFNPKHQILYEFLHMQPLGGLKSYSATNGSPALARHLNVADTAQLAGMYPVLQFFYDISSSPKPFAKKLRLTASHLRELFVESSAVFRTSSSDEIAHIRTCYPDYAFETVLHGITQPDLSAFQSV